VHFKIAAHRRLKVDASNHKNGDCFHKGDAHDHVKMDVLFPQRFGRGRKNLTLKKIKSTEQFERILNSTSPQFVKLFLVTDFFVTQAGFLTFKQHVHLKRRLLALE